MHALSLESNSIEWTGTFHLAVAFVAQDLLRDGAGVRVLVRTEAEGELDGSLTTADTTHLVIAGRRVKIADNITGFYVD
ncbi:Uncharacterised protein (plasmid) [Tsukamurella tyrosinosolvens]|uniref:Uncharacterized protein n=1 Tax=Tsukamurella tyrosinosolvens TaxID=57704 RepID=A0A1H4V4Z7_TSUTY|nr:hypothetical protein [Tsukamurella tyrosinosolvens]KXO91048.1 hypothetical protein AXK58_21700 [Tsukamurella tyrosinosolvens]SEC76015.1 hypothetical protein SAMN04489793_3142 [Tsukamurella tyrosinosolvens]VEH90683.1 Uncharacterised protein [Tsukamurella tyrosinosolvens]